MVVPIYAICFASKYGSQTVPADKRNVKYGFIQRVF